MSEIQAFPAFEDTLTLRDYFATEALASIGTWIPLTTRAPYHHDPDLKSDEALKARAEWAYRQADAMLEARGE